MINQPPRPPPVFMRFFLKGWHSSPRRGTWQTPSVGEVPEGVGAALGETQGRRARLWAGLLGALG